MSVERSAVDVGKAGQFAYRDRSDVLAFHYFEQRIADSFFSADNSFVSIVSGRYSHKIQPFYTMCIFIHTCIL